MFNEQVSIVLSGEAGQGLDTIESLFIRLLKESGFNTFLSREFMSRIRGGNNTSEIRVSSEKVQAFVEKIDILIMLSPDGADRLEKRLTAATIIIGANVRVPEKFGEIGCQIIPIEFEEKLAELGGKIYTNIIVIGMLTSLLACDHELAKELIRTTFMAKGEEIVNKNLVALQQGIDISSKLDITISIEPDAEATAKTALNGSEAIGIGAIAGGCNFIASYPMSPSTGVLAYLAKQAEEHGIIVEQAEDEIAAINMMLGAWYAGARAMVTTSGGGFALMSEGMSLAGCVESPAVIHLAQRPGPATGLPTRTEQGDLNLALYAGHGDFPRVIYAPGKFEDAIRLTQKAFDLADQFQIPVILLTDQYFLDSIGITEQIDFTTSEVNNSFIETSQDYQRYALTPSGVSPRGIPGYGKGLVCADSDEHSENGRITEDFDMRVAMVDKRMRKLEGYRDIEPELIGNKDYSTLIIGWGSTYGAICEALKLINRDDVAFAFFKQVFPVPGSAFKLMEKAQKRIVIENNATGQFGKLLEMETLLKVHEKILKYNGTPFAVEELVEKIVGGLSS